MIDETAREIQDMRTHSASEVAIKAAHALIALQDREYPSIEEFLVAIERNSKTLRQANPSHASLQNTQRAIVADMEDAELSSLEEASTRLADTIDATVNRVLQAKSAAAANAEPLLADGDVLLTHDYSTTVLETIEQAIEAGKGLEVFVLEARPRFLGRRMARRLAELPDLEVTLIIDNAAGHFLRECDRVLVGMSCIVEEQLYNRIGTYGIATTAVHRNVPVTTVGAATKVIRGGFAFENEHRTSIEVMREPTDAFQIANPAYDATPLSLIDEVVTDEGIDRNESSG